MKRTLVLTTIVLVVVAISSAVVQAQTTEPVTPTLTFTTDTSPYPGPVGVVNDITADFESLSDLAGLGVAVSLLVMVLRLAGLPDSYGGYAAAGVGLFVFVATKLLPAENAETLFDAVRHGSEFLMVILGSQLTHFSAKRMGLDRVWKVRE